MLPEAPPDNGILESLGALHKRLLSTEASLLDLTGSILGVSDAESEKPTHLYLYLTADLRSCHQTVGRIEKLVSELNVSFQG